MDINKYVKDIQKILRIQDIDIEIKFNDEMDECAKIKNLYYIPKSILVLKNNNNINELKQSIIHELLHVKFAKSYDMAIENIPQNLEEYYNRENELAIDSLATVIFNLLKKTT